MKLRIKGNSLRLRLLRSEVTNLLESGRLEEQIHFASSTDATWTYALEHDRSTTLPTLRYSDAEIVVVLPTPEAERWAKTEQTGIYAHLNIGRNGTLEVIVEKDFACLDLSDDENVDTFPNPNAGAVC